MSATKISYIFEEYDFYIRLETINLQKLNFINKKNAVTIMSSKLQDGNS